MVTYCNDPSNGHPTDAEAFAGWTIYQRWLVAQLARAAQVAGATGAEHDELLPLDQVPLEARARRRAVRDGKLPVARIGRKLYVRRSALLRLVPDVADVEAGRAASDPREAAAAEYARGRTQR